MAKEKTYKIFDGEGLYLEVNPKERKSWRMKYRYGKKEKRLTFGSYPTVTLKEARDQRYKAKKLLADNIDPSLHKKMKKAQHIETTENTFQSLALEWHNNWKSDKDTKHALTTWNRLEGDIFPFIGHIPVSEINPQMILKIVRAIEERKAFDVARRAKIVCGQIFRFGVAVGKAERDVTADLKDAMRPYKGEHFPSLDISELPKFLDAVECPSSAIHYQTRLAIKFMMLTFVRTSELIQAEWDEISWDERIWSIPARKMKMKREHLVPLSVQSIEILEELKRLNGHRQYIFTSEAHPRKHMSNGTILGAIKRIGYKGKMSGHGFRALATTTINENLNYPMEVIDRQLAHAQPKLEQAYNRAKFIDKRKIMMQDYADYIESIK